MRRPGRTDLRAFLADLRTAVRRQWRAEELRRRLSDPEPIPVRWQVASAELGVQDHWVNVLGAGGVEPRSGTIDDLASTLRRLPSTRLVILGEPGAGKTTAAIRLVLDLIDDVRDGDPVPVLLSLGSWQAREQDLPDWLAAALSTDYPALGAEAGDGRTVAQALVEDGRVLPVLDGLDELPAPSRAPAILAINAALHRGDPLVLTCRTAEYLAAVDASDALTSAAVIELQPLGLGDLAAYLPRTARPRPDSTTAWDRLLAELRRRPDDERARDVLHVLSTPLMTSLAREAYSDTGTEPVELLDRERFATIADVRAHLLDQTIPTAYRRPGRSWQPPRATRWLIVLARLLDAAGTYDLAWWRLTQLGSGRLAAGVGAVVGAVTMCALSVAVVHNAALLGTLVLLGAATGAFLGVRQPPVPSTAQWSVAGGFGRLWRAGTDLRHLHRRPVATSAVWWLLAVLAVVTFVGIRAGWLAATLGGVAVCVIRGLDAWLDVPADVTAVPSPASLLRADRTTGLSRAALRGVLVGGVTSVLAGPPIGGSVGLAAFVASAGFTAWGRFTLARVWYAASAQLPWRLYGFLDDAVGRGLLRQVGGTYQFRHAQVQDRLAGRPLIAGDVVRYPPVGNGTQVPDDRPTPAPPTRHRETGPVVVLLTALELEHSAVRAHLVGLRPVVHPAGTVFEIGTLPGCPRRIALAALGEGNQTSAVVTERSATLFRPDFMLFVGVAGALDPGMVLGDVVVATRVYSYQSGRDSTDGFLARPRAWEAPHHLEQQARYLSRTGQWRALLPDPAHPPAVHFRPIVAGEVVMTTSDSALAEIIRRHYDDAAAVEMEGAGLVRAAHLNRALPVLVVRGISDYADSGKHDLDRGGWQRIAAANVAAFALSLVASLPLDG